MMGSALRNRSRVWLIAAVAGLGLVLALAAGRVYAQTEPGDPEARAIRLFDEGRYAEAAETFRAILAQNPNDRTANVLLSFALARQEQWALAIEQTRQALSLFPDNVKLQLLLAGLLSRQRDTLDDARERFQAILRRDPDNRLALLGLAETEYNRGNNFGLIEHFSRLVEREPGDARFQVRIAQGWASLGGLERSLEHYQKAYALAPANLDAIRSLGILADVLDRPRDALQYYQELAELFPTEVSVQVAVQRSRENLEEPRFPLPVEELQKIPLEAYREALEKNSVQLKKRAEQITAMKVRSAARFLPTFFVSPSSSTVDSQLRTRAGRDETTTLGFSFGWNIGDLLVDPFQINLTGLQADLAAVRASLTMDATGTYYQRLNEIGNYRNLQRALALDPDNVQLRQNKRGMKLGIINLSERLRVLTGRP